MKDDIQKYLNSGITDYLLKPFKEVHLYNKIVSLLKLTPGNKSVSKQNGSNKANGVARTETTKQSLFNIEEILMFTGARNESLLEVLESFINSSTSSILMMDSGLKNRDWEKVSMMAHKMLPSYQHLKIDTVVPMLKTLERLNGNIKPNEIESLVQKVSKRSEEAIKAIKLEVIQLKKELSKKQVAN
jgi:YesN/AraC family two-component response regulator